MGEVFAHGRRGVRLHRPLATLGSPSSCGARDVVRLAERRPLAPRSAAMPAIRPMLEPATAPGTPRAPPAWCELPGARSRMLHHNDASPAPVSAPVAAPAIPRPRHGADCANTDVARHGEFRPVRLIAPRAARYAWAEVVRTFRCRTGRYTLAGTAGTRSPRDRPAQRANAALLRSTLGPQQGRPWRAPARSSPLASTLIVRDARLPHATRASACLG
jgi:hypothetical protein